MDKPEHITQRVSRRHFDIFLLLLIPVAAFTLSLALQLNVLWSVILFTIVPSLYLTYLLPRSALKSAIFSAVVTPLMLVIMDPIAVLSRAWYIPTTSFSFRLFDIIPIEEAFWGFFTLYMVVMFYEYFFDTSTKGRWWNRRMLYLLCVLIVLASIILALLFIYPKALNIPFGFMWFGTIIFLIPVVVELYRHPAMAGKFFLTGAYFFFHSLLYEVAALKLGWWQYPGTGSAYIGTLTLSGVSLPFEEFFFFWILNAMAALSYYEFFDDDER